MDTNRAAHFDVDHHIDSAEIRARRLKWEEGRWREPVAFGMRREDAQGSGQSTLEGREAQFVEAARAASGLDPDGRMDPARVAFLRRLEGLWKTRPAICTTKDDVR